MQKSPLTFIVLFLERGILASGAFFVFIAGVAVLCVMCVQAVWLHVNVR